MKNRKAFTLIELLVVVILIGILLIIAIPAVSRYLKRGTKEYYSNLEESVLLAGRDYLNDYRALLPKKIDNVTVIQLDELTKNKYLDEVVDDNGNKCTAKVTVKKVKNGKYEYYSCLDCGDSYKTSGEACDYDENDNITEETKNYRIEVDPDEYIVNQGDDFELPYGKVYYTKNGVESLLSVKVNPNPKIIDTNKVGTIKVNYTYKGATKEVTVKVIDKVAPSIPQIVLKYDNKSGALYQGNWYSGDIYQEFNSMDYDENGQVGSGIDRYEISADGTNYKKLDSNYQITTENGDYTFYARSVDKSGNISYSNIYNLKIDKENPKCILKSTGTSGENDWYIDDVTVSFDSIEENVSSIAISTIDKSNLISDGKYSAIGTVTDQAGNVGVCSKNISIDKTNPIVSYNVASGTYIEATTVQVTGSDNNFSHMSVHVYKDGVYQSSKSVTSTNLKTFDVNLESDGNWIIYTQVYDKSGRKQNQSPIDENGWYYQSYTIAIPKEIPVTAANYSGIYDGEEHTATISTTLTGTTFKYGLTEGTYDISDIPKFTNAGTYTIYYQASKEGYITTTGTATVTISKAQGTISLSIADNMYIQATTNSGGTITAVSANTNIIKNCTILDNKKVRVNPYYSGKLNSMKFGDAGTTIITVTVAETPNYTSASATQSVTVGENLLPTSVGVNTSNNLKYLNSSCAKAKDTIGNQWGISNAITLTTGYYWFAGYTGGDPRACIYNGSTYEKALTTSSGSHYYISGTRTYKTSVFAEPGSYNVDISGYLKYYCVRKITFN